VSGQWSFLTNHAVVLACVAKQPDIRLRILADCSGITERAAHRILNELVEAGYVTRHRVGRRNYYDVDPEQALRSPFERDNRVGELLAILLGPGENSAAEPGWT
jgi:DNA-binding transcriptional ArsR family regulator